MRGGHTPVLLKEVMEMLRPEEGETAVDCTLGLGGHAVEIAKAIGPSGTLVGFDLDAGNLARAGERVRETGAKFVGVHGSFASVREVMEARGLRADAALADLGFSSNQMDDAERGMSFMREAPLDMRMDRSGGLTAADLLMQLSEEELADLIFNVGGDPLARRIARKLAQKLEREPIQTTSQLVQVVNEAYGARAAKSRRQPATRTFMALRMAVNDETGALERLMEAVREGAAEAASGGWLKPGTRVGVITFQSNEDRMVKQAFSQIVKQGHGTLPARKPITASEEEAGRNPRSRSAKLRVIKIHADEDEAKGRRMGM
ncbi:MAG TPA: 16S rRNA (cytosine(1402)-N(4))-methyltransferase RsmH [Phycisphaerales bacterium]|nr:16S rRNA (cytosine(1402)-N(4))-methyltransferase RsmH [Phycisphaerales bacterium]